MTPEQLQQAIQKLRKSNSKVSCFIEVPEVCTLQWPPCIEKPADNQALRELILNFQATDGWLCWQSEVSHFQNSALDYPANKHLLYGELAKPNASLHINEDGQGGWIVTWLEEGAGKQVAVTNTTLLGESKHAPEKLYYRVYWQNSAEDGFRKIAARFQGFKGEK